MSVEETERTGVTMMKEEPPSKQVAREQVMRRWLRRPPPDLARPFGALHWPLTCIGLLCAVLALLVFARVFDLGTIAINWTITFNVNIVVAAVVLIAGLLSIVPKALKNPHVWRSRNTIISIVVLLLVAIFFLSRLLNLGIFQYTLTSLDFNLLALAVLLCVLIWLALRGSAISGLTLLILFLWWGFSIEGFDLPTITRLFTGKTSLGVLKSLVPPDWSYFGHVINPMLLTIQTAIIATVIGVIGALPLSILGARNTSPHPVIYNIVRLFVNTLRAIPALVLALLFIAMMGLGPVAGAFGLGLHTISVLTKLYAESFESVKPQPIEALQAVGANGLKTFRWAVFPQAFPLLVSYSIYYWESNTRDATVVAFVGGGGIGLILQENLSLLQYADVSVILVVLVITVALLDRISDFVRSRVI